MRGDHLEAQSGRSSAPERDRPNSRPAGSTGRQAPRSYRRPATPVVHALESGQIANAIAPRHRLANPGLRVGEPDDLETVVLTRKPELCFVAASKPPEVGGGPIRGPSIGGTDG